MSTQTDQGDPAGPASTRSDSSKQDAAPSPNHRRRRGVGIVTPNACTECRKKRAKCDGNTPCTRCEVNGTECKYEIPVRQSKDAMRQEIEQLRSSRRQTERLVTALTSGHKVEETLNRLRNGQNLEHVSEWLKNESLKGKGSSGKVTEYSSPGQQNAIQKSLTAVQNVVTNMEPLSWPTWATGSSEDPQSAVHSHGDDAMNWQTEAPESDASPQLSSPFLGTTKMDGETSDDMRMARGRGQDHILGPMYSVKEGIADVSVWTTVTDNAAVVEHLMALYFCWEYPTFASLSKEHFLTDFRSGQARYCSSLLVNAMCALGCRFSTLPQSRSDPDDPDTSGEHFFAEAKRLLFEDDHKSLTTIQALGLMSIREASCGRDTESFFFSGQAIRLSLEAGLHIEASDRDDTNVGGMDHEVRSATFWGAFALDAAWSLCAGRIPCLSRAANLVQKPSIIQQIESSEWVPYTDDGSPLTKSAAQPSNVRSVFRCFAELSELVHQTLYALYTPGRSLTSSEVVSVYFRYLNWYNSLPEALRLGHNFTPAVLFAHMYYHFAILMLLRPFIKLRFIGSGVNARDVCAQAADAITTLVRSYDHLYSLARTPSFVPYITLASSIMHLVIGTSSDLTPSQPPNVNIVHDKPRKQILQAVRYLQSMSSCHGFARRSLDIVRFLAYYWHISTDSAENHRHTLNLALSSQATSSGSSPSTPISTSKSGDDQTFTLKDLQLRCQMSSASINLFCPDIGTALPDMGPTSQLALFSPFPMQGLPLLAGENEESLARDGFEMLGSKDWTADGERYKSEGSE